MLLNTSLVFIHTRLWLRVIFSLLSTKRTWSKPLLLEWCRTSRTRLLPWGQWLTAHSTWRTSQRLTGTWRPIRTWARSSSLWFHRNRKLRCSEIWQKCHCSDMYFWFMLKNLTTCWKKTIFFQILWFYVWLNIQHPKIKYSKYLTFLQCSFCDYSDNKLTITHFKYCVHAGDREASWQWKGLYVPW